MLLIIWDV